MNDVINSCLVGVNSAGRIFCYYAAGMFVQSSVLIIVLLIIDFLLRKRVRATFRYCIWMLVFAKLVLPPTLCLPTGIGYWCGDYLSTDSHVLQPVSNIVQLESARTATPKGFAPPIETAEPQPSQVLPEAVTPAASTLSSTEPIAWQGVLFLVWLAGVLIISILLLQRLRFVRWLIAQSSSANGQLLDLLNECRRQVGIRRNIGLRLSGDTSSPAVCGLFKPIILMPTSLVDDLSPDKLRAVFIHELAHIRRGDLWVNFAQTLLQIVYFYNPFVWLANAVVRRIREQAVDEMVLVSLGPEAKNYSNTLIDIAELAFWRAGFSLRLIGVVESKKALRRRIRHMLTRPMPKSAKIGIFGLLAVVVMAAVLLPMAEAEKTSISDTEMAQQQRVRELVYILRNYTLDLTNGRTEQWTAAIRDLVEIGKPAVPELIAELDRTNRDNTIRAIGFTLRAIGDPRAVPALIRALPKTAPRGSDLGVWVFDPNLHAFMVEHQRGSGGEEYPEFSYGRAVNEISTALEKITGHSEGKDHIRAARSDDPEAIKAVQQTRTRAAKRWQDWWSQHWSEFLTQKELDSASIPPRAGDPVEAAGIAKFGPPIPSGKDFRLGPVTKMVVPPHHPYPGRPEDGKAYLDLDTGKLMTIFESGRPPFGDVQWYAQSGVDACATRWFTWDMRSGGFKLEGFGTHVWQIDNSRWETMEDEIHSETPLKLGPPRRGPGFYPRSNRSGWPGYDNSNFPATFLLTTREGGAGILQIVESSDKPPGVRLRYRMIEGPVSKARPMVKTTKDRQRAAGDISGESQFAATLPNGVTVELVGICEHPSKGNKWWRANGTIIEDDVRPYAFKELRTLRLPLNQQENKILELAVKITDFSDRNVGIICSGANRTFINCRNNVWGGTVEVGKEPAVKDFKIGVAAGAWETLASSGSRFGGRRRKSPDIVFTEAYNTQEGYAIVIVTHKKDIQKENWQVVAIDKEGELHNADLYQTQGIGEFEQDMFHFKRLKSDQIRRFEFQTRPYQWVTFRNVSLRPGHKSNVQVEVVGQAGALAEKRKVYLPDLETPDAEVVLDLATSQMLSAEGMEKDQQYFEKLGKGDIVYEYASGEASLLCLRGAKMQLVTNDGLVSLKPDVQRQYFTGYLLKDVPCQYQVTTAEGEKYELKVLSVDKGDTGGAHIEYWKADVQVEGETPDEKAGLVWGKPVEGVQVRLRADKYTWEAEEKPIFKADIRNRGELGLSVFAADEFCQLEFDAMWYGWSGPWGRPNVERSLLGPGSQINDISISLAKKWVGKRNELALTAGTHTVRIAFVFQRAERKYQDLVRAVSNPIEIKILPAKPDAQVEVEQAKKGRPVADTSILDIVEMAPNAETGLRRPPDEFSFLYPRLEKGPYILYGTVTDTDGSAAKGVTVVAFRGEMWEWGLAETVTAQDGSYVFRDLPDGPYHLIAVHPDAFTVVPISLGSPWQKGSTLRQDLAMEPFGPTAITGRVLDKKGEPVPDALIVSCGGWGSYGRSLALQTRTGTDGRYTIRQWNNKPIIGDPLVAVAQGHEPGLLLFAVAQGLKLGVRRPDIVLRGAHISGTVRFKDSGKPAPGVTVTLRRRGDLWHPKMTKVTDASGAFVFDRLVPGLCTLKIDNPNEGYTSTKWPELNLWKDRKVEGLELLISSGASISGTVAIKETGEPLAGVRLWIPNTSAPRVLREAITGPDGRYDLGCLPAGKFTVRCEVPPNVVREYHDPQHGSPPEERNVSVGLDEHAAGIDFSFERGVTISGRVTDKQGNPVAGACLRATNIGGGRPSRRVYTSDVETAADGTYRLTGFVPSAAWKYSVTVGASGYGLIGSQPFQVSGDVSGKDFVLEKAAVVSGRLVDTAGQWIPFAEVRLKSMAEKEYARPVPNPVYADEQGRFTFREGAYPGMYYFEVHLVNMGFGPYSTKRAENKPLIIADPGYNQEVEVIVATEDKK